MNEQWSGEAEGSQWGRGADGTNNGFFVHSRHLWWQNEDTARMKNLVDRRPLDDLLKGVQPGPKSPFPAMPDTPGHVRAILRWPL